MLNSLRTLFSSLYKKITTQFNALFAKDRIDESTIKEIEKILLEADCGVNVTKKIIYNLQTSYHQGTVVSGKDAKKLLADQLLPLLPQPPHLDEYKAYLLVGVNGSGKTTTIGKLATMYRKEGKKVLIVAADTFRAAATQQLAAWAERAGAAIVTGDQGQDPASVVYTGCQKFQEGGFDILLIDTAGRLQTKAHLMKELEKIKRVMTKTLPEHTIATLLTVDAMLGQNSFEQARLFHESVKLDGIILTKMDGTAKGGIVFAIGDEFKTPIIFISYGEQPEHIKPFDPQDYVDTLLA